MSSEKLLNIIKLNTDNLVNTIRKLPSSNKVIFNKNEKPSRINRTGLRFANVQEYIYQPITG